MARAKDLTRCDNWTVCARCGYPMELSVGERAALSELPDTAPYLACCGCRFRFEMGRPVGSRPGDAATADYIRRWVQEIQTATEPTPTVERDADLANLAARADGGDLKASALVLLRAFEAGLTMSRIDRARDWATVVRLIRRRLDRKGGGA